MRTEVLNDEGVIAFWHLSKFNEYPRKKVALSQLPSSLNNYTTNTAVAAGNKACNIGSMRQASRNRAELKRKRQRLNDLFWSTQSVLRLLIACILVDKMTRGRILGGSILKARLRI